MSTVILVVLCAAPFIGLYVYMSMAQSRREARALRDFAALLDAGEVKGRRAVGRWKGVDMSVGHLGRLNPPVFLTRVAALRRPSPVAAWLVPRTGEYQVPPEGQDAPKWLVALDRHMVVGCAPPEAFRVVVDEAIATLLTSLADTEVDFLPDLVNVQRREFLDDARQVIPLLDAACQLVRRFDDCEAALQGATEEEQLRRRAETARFLASLR